eukprot:COSAG05_NODE_428_length_9890_cov_4.534470_4_plen_206_part_00
MIVVSPLCCSQSAALRDSFESLKGSAAAGLNLVFAGASGWMTGGSRKRGGGMMIDMASFAAVAEDAGITLTGVEDRVRQLVKASKGTGCVAPACAQHCIRALAISHFSAVCDRGMALSEREALRMLSLSGHDATAAADFLAATRGEVLSALALLEEIARQLPECKIPGEDPAVLIAMELLEECEGDVQLIPVTHNPASRFQTIMK